MTVRTFVEFATFMALFSCMLILQAARRKEQCLFFGTDARIVLSVPNKAGMDNPCEQGYEVLYSIRHPKENLNFNYFEPTWCLTKINPNGR